MQHFDDEAPVLGLYAFRKVRLLTILDLSFKPRYLMTFEMGFIFSSSISAAPHMFVCAPQIRLASSLS
jgi:hypothetical protein